jgi:hypothetical protein
MWIILYRVERYILFPMQASDLKLLYKAVVALVAAVVKEMKLGLPENDHEVIHNNPLPHLQRHHSLYSLY